jgi:beta-galactosidase
MPGRLREAVGATYNEYTNLTSAVPLKAGAGFELAEAATGTAWADALVPEGAETLVHYEHPHLGRWAAVTSHPRGSGRVTYVGTLPDRALAVALARWLRRLPDPWEPRPESVTVTSGCGSQREIVWFVTNWSWEPARLAMPVMAKDLLSGIELASGEDLVLGAWDVRVLLERHREKDDEEGRPLA